MAQRPENIKTFYSAIMLSRKGGTWQINFLPPIFFGGGGGWEGAGSVGSLFYIQWIRSVRVVSRNSPALQKKVSDFPQLECH
jgi:hypothetical protein